MKRRLLTSLVLIIIFTPIIIIGKIPFIVGVALLSFLGFRDLINLYEKNRKVPFLIKILSYLSVMILSVSQSSLLTCICLIILLMYIPLLFIDSSEYNYEDACKMFSSVIFVGVLFYSITSIRLSSIEEFLYLLSITILTDTFAYLGGNIFGKHKLSKISPKKTLEGLITGLIVGSVIPSIYYLYFVNQGMSLVLIIMMTITISLLSQIGDLVFSSIKRHYNVKDYSNVFPGHGGVFDRFDSLLFAGITYIIGGLIW